jgi:alkylhydroperoxidase/carboxymuconolactone decarboxylase family protein YurZ
MGEAATASGRGFLDTGLDFGRDEFDPDEKAAMLAWYDEAHEWGGLRLAPFAGFWIEHDPGGFKRLKRHLLTLDEQRDGVTLPVAAGVLMYVHTYTAVGNGKGALYEVVAARELGASRSEVLDAVRHAMLHGGPIGLNPLADIAGPYFDDWEDGPSAIAWPAGWAPDPAAFRSGIDHGTDDLPAGELALVTAWHERMHGEVPAHVPALARLHPRAYKTLRLRQEAAVGGALPAQLFPLLTLHLAAVTARPVALRRAAQEARALGVRRHQAVSTLFWAAVPGGEAAFEQAWTAVADVLEDMP